MSTSFAKKIKSVAGCDQNVVISTPKTIVICDDKSTKSGDPLAIEVNDILCNADMDVSEDIPVDSCLNESINEI